MKYWLREPGSTKFAGPMTEEELKEGILSGLLSLDYEVLPWKGQSEGQLLEPSEWRVLSSLELAKSLPQVEPKILDSLWLRRVALRRQSAYDVTRFWANFLSCICYVILAIMMFVAFGMGVREITGWYVLASLPFSLLFVITCHQGIIILCDIADRNLRSGKF